MLVLDCQATGASPKHGHLLEIGWLPMRAGEDTTRSPSCTLVKLPDGSEIPPMVKQLTGLEADDLVDAPSPAEVWARLRAVAQEVGDDGVAPAVIHFARFERSFLEALHAEIEPDAAFPLRMLCTHEIARRLLPGMPRRGLKALAGYFGHGKSELLRAQGHVDATALVWRHLTEKLAEHGVTTLAELEAYLKRPAPKAGKRVYPMPREKRLGLPDEPGVYRLLRTSGDVLYVGKATSLKKRVNSYFQKQKRVSDRMLEMLSQVRDLRVTPTKTPLEAALLESDEIKHHDPPYNVALKTEGRAAWFAVPGFGELSRQATRRATVGPLGSAWYARRWVALKAALAARTFDDETANAVRVAARAPFGTDERELLGGVVGFINGLGGVALDERSALALGARLWAEQLRIGAEVPEIDDEEPEDEDTVWDAAKIHEKLDEAVMTIAHVIRRAGWLRRLAESTVIFDDGAPRILSVRGGMVEAIDEVEPPRTTTYRQRRRAFDLPTFDRLRVLTTELRRVVEAGQPVEIHFGRGHPLSGDRLRQALRWV